jgi:beta-N-acetylglucosaminidase
MILMKVAPVMTNKAEVFVKAGSRNGVNNLFLMLRIMSGRGIIQT